VSARLRCPSFSSFPPTRDPRVGSESEHRSGPLGHRNLLPRSRPLPVLSWSKHRHHCPRPGRVPLLGLPRMVPSPTLLPASLSPTRTISLFHQSPSSLFPSPSPTPLSASHSVVNCKFRIFGVQRWRARAGGSLRRG
jgi:hypothetical protein